MRKRRTFVRRFLRCIFHQHILVRPAGFELVAYRVGVIRPSEENPLDHKGFSEVAHFSVCLQKTSKALAAQRLQAFFNSRQIVVKLTQHGSIDSPGQ